MKIHWTRIQNKIRENCTDSSKAECILEQLQALDAFYESQRTDAFFRKTESLISLGIYLATASDPEIIIPCCADFSESDGRYDFVALRGGVPLSVKKFEHTIEALKRIFQNVRITVLISESEVFVLHFPKSGVGLRYRRKLKESCRAVKATLDVYSDLLGIGAFFETASIFVRKYLDKKTRSLMKMRSEKKHKTLLHGASGNTRPQGSPMRPWVTLAQYIHIMRYAKRRGSALLLHDNPEVSLFNDFAELKTGAPVLGSRRL